MASILIYYSEKDNLHPTPVDHRPAGLKVAFLTGIEVLTDESLPEAVGLLCLQLTGEKDG